MSTRDEDHMHFRLIQQILTLPPDRLDEVEHFFAQLQTSAVPSPLPSLRLGTLAAGTSAERDWPHAPVHRLGEHGTFIVTSGTYEKAHFFRGTERLDYLESTLLALAKEFGWQLEAWAVFSNHYHFVAHSPPNPNSLSALTKELHGRTSHHVNQLDQVSERQVWFNYWATRLTFEKSCLARLSYVHRNPVKHGLVSSAAHYRWCSAAWLERSAPRAQVETIYRFKIDKISIHDDFDPL
jgi:putative transposase